MRLTFVCLVFALLSARNAQAQPSSQASIDPTVTAMLFFSSELVGAPGAAAALPEDSSFNGRLMPEQRLSRGRWLTSIGTGLVAGSVTGLAAFGRSFECYNGPAGNSSNVGPSRIYAGMVGSVGVGLIAFGIARLLSVPKESRQRMHASGGAKAGMILGAIGSALWSTAATGAIWTFSSCDLNS